MGRHIYENPARPAHWTEAAMKAAVDKVYIVSFRSHDDRRPSKFIVLADNRKEAIKIDWEHGGADFQSRFDKSTGQAQEMKAGALRVRDSYKREAWETHRYRFPSSPFAQVLLYLK
jgi:hypothetical protein